MKIDPQFIKIINENLTGVLVLKEVGYQDDDIRRNEDHNLQIRCPIHKESVFHSLSLDDGKRAFFCAYPLCPGNKGGSFFDLYCTISRKDEESALIFWSTALKIDVHELVKKFVALAEDALANKDTNNAVLNFQKAIALAPGQVDYRKSLLSIFLKQSKKAAAADQCLELGKITLLQKQMTSAIKYFQDALSLSNPPKEETYQSIADIYMAASQDGLLKEFLLQQSRDEADLPTRQVILNILTSMEPDNAAYLRARADVEIELKQVNNALLSLRDLLQILDRQQDFPNIGETLKQLTQIDGRSQEWKNRLVFHELLHGDRTAGASLGLQCAQAMQKNKQVAEAIKLLADIRQYLSDSLDLNIYYVDLLKSDKKNSEAVTVLKQGLQQTLDSKDYATASIYCKKAREIDPTDLSLQHVQVEIALNTGNKKAAAVLYQSLADAYIQQKDHAKAVSMLEAALEIDTDDNTLREKMAGLMAQQNNVKQAIEQHLILLNKSLNKNDYGHAEKIVQQILTLDRDNITAVENLINIYRKSRKIDKEFGAIFDLAKIYLRQDNSRQVRYYCGIILEKNPGFDDAHQLLIGMEKRVGRKMVYIRRLATHYIHINKNKEALKLYNSIYESLPNNLSNLLNRIYALENLDTPVQELKKYYLEIVQKSEKSNKVPIAFEYLHKALHIDESDLELHEYNIRLFKKHSDIRTSLKDREQLVELMSHLAEAFVKKNLVIKAIELIKEIIQLIPENLDYHYQLAGLYLQQKNHPQAIAQFLFLQDKTLRNQDYAGAEKLGLQVLELDKENLIAIHNLIDVYQHTRKTDKEQDMVYVLAKILFDKSEFSKSRHTALYGYRKFKQTDVFIKFLIDTEARKGRQAVYLNWFASLYFKQNKLNEALICLNKISDLIPGHLRTMMNRLNILESLKIPAPELVKIYLSTAEQAITQKQINIARTLLDKALRLDKSNAGIWERKIDLFQKHIDFKHSDADLKVYLQLLKDARKLYSEQNDFPRSIALLQELLVLQPDDRKLRLELAELFILNNESSLALEQYQYLLKSSVTDLNIPESEKLAKEINQLSPDNIVACEQLLSLYRATGSQDKVITTLFLLSQIQVKGKAVKEAYKNLLLLLSISNKFEPTLQLLIEIEKRNIRKSVFIRKLADLYCLQKKFTEALALNRSALLLIPGNLSLQYRIVDILQKTKATPAELTDTYIGIIDSSLKHQLPSVALAYLDKSIQLNPLVPEYYLRKISVLKTSSTGTQSPETRKSLLEVMTALAALYTQQKQTDNAIVMLQEILELNPENLDIRERLTTLLISRKSVPEAISQYAILLDQYTQNNELQKAETCAVQIIQLDSENIPTLQKLIELYARLKNPDREIECLIQLTRLYQTKKQIPEVRATGYSILRKSPNHPAVLEILLQVETRNYRKAVYLRRLGDGNKDQKKLNDAVGLYRKALELVAGNLSLQYRIVEILQTIKTTPAELTKLYLGIVDSALKHQQPGVAISYMDKALELNPTDTRFYVKKIDILKTQYSLEASPAVREHMIQVMKELAGLYSNQKQPDQSITLYREILELNPALLEIRGLLTELLISQKSLPDAIEQYSVLLSQYFDSGDMQNAERVGLRIIELNPENIPTLQKLIELYARLKNPDREIECLIQLTRLYQTKKQIPEVRATGYSILRKSPNHPAVLEILLQVETRNYRKAVYLRRLGDGNKDQKKLNDAVGLYRKALELVAGNLSLQYRIVEILQTIKTTPAELTKLYLGIVDSALKHQQPGVAISYMDKALELNPTDTRFYVKKIDILKTQYSLEASPAVREHMIQVMKELAGLYSNQKQPDQSITLYREILELNPALLEIRGLLTELLISQKSLPDAIEQYSVLLSQYFDSGDMKNAERVGLRIIELNPENIPTLQKLIELYARLKNPDREIECLIQLTRLYQTKKQIPEVRATGYSILRKSPNHPAVLEILLQVETRNYRKAVYLRRLGDGNKDQKKLNDAVGLYRKALELVAGNLSLQYRIVEILQTIKTTPAELTKLYLGIVDSALKHQQPGVAISYMDKALELNPTDTRFYVKKIDILKTQYSLEASPAVREHMIQVMKELAGLYSNQKQPDQSITLYREILELNPALLEIRGLLTELLISQKSLPDAIEQYSVLLSQYFDSGDMQNAERVGLRIIELQKDNIPVLHKLVLIYGRQKSNKELEFLFKLAVLYQSQKQFKDARYSCWLILQKASMPAAVIELLLQMESRNPRKAIYIRRLATLDLKAGKMADGISRYRKVIELVPENLGSWKTISSLLERSKASPPDIKIAFLKVVQIAVSLNRIPLAIEYIDKARGLDAKDLGLYEKKIALYREYYDIKQDIHRDYLIKMMVELAEVFASIKNTSSALSLYKEILELSPAQQNIRIKYADLHAFSKNHPEAIEQYVVLVNEFMGSKNYASVETYSRKIIDLDKMNIPAWQVLVNLYKLQTNRSALIDALLQITAIYRSQKAITDIIDYSKQVLRLQGDNENALQFLAEAETRIGRKSIYLRRIAQVRVSANKLQDAMDYYRKIMAILPQNIGTKIALSVLLEKAKASAPDLKSIYLMVVDNAVKRIRIPLAIEFLDKAYHLDSKDLTLFEKKLGLYRKHYDIAQKNYRDAFISMMAELAEAWQKTATPDKSISLYKEILTMDENRLDIREELAVLYAILDNSKDAIDQCYQLIDQYFNRQDYKNAEKVGKRVLELDPQHIPAIKYLVKIYHQTNQTTNEIETLLTLGGIYRSQASVKIACQTCQRVLQIHHENEPALVMLAEMENRKGRKSVYIRRLADIKFKNKKLAEAIDYYRRIQVSLPDNLGTKITLVSLLEKAKVNPSEIKLAYLSTVDAAVKKHNVPLAIEYVDKARKLDSKDISLYEKKINLFRGYYDLQKPEPKNELFDLLVELSRIYAGGNNQTHAISLYQEALQLLPDRADIRVEYADINAGINNQEAIGQYFQLLEYYLSQKDYKTSEELCRKVLALDKENIPALQSLIRIYHDQDKTSREIETLLFLANLYRLKKLDTEACNSSKSILRLDAQNEAALILLAEMESRQGRKSIYLRRLAVLKLAQKKGAEAISYYRDIFRILPQNLGTQLTLSDLLEKAKISASELKALYLHIADTANKRAKVQLTIDYLDKAYRVDSKDFGILEKKIQCFREYYDISQVQYRQNLISMLVELAESYQATKSTDKAVLSYLDVLSLEPESLDIRKNLAGLYIGLKKVTEAIGQYSYLLEYYFNHRDYPKAEEMSQCILSLESASVFATQYRVQIYQQVKDTPRQIEALIQLAALYRNTKQGKAAMGCLLQVLSLQPQHETALSTLVELESRAGRKAIYIRRIAMIRFRANKLNESVALVKKIRELVPENLGSQLSLISLLEKSNAPGPELKSHYLQAATLSIKYQKKTQVLEYYDKARKLDAKDLSVYDSKINYYKTAFDVTREEYRNELLVMQEELADAYQSLNEPDKAVSLLHEILKIVPENLDVRTKLAMLYNKQKKNQEAVEQFTLMFNAYLDKKSFDIVEKIGQQIMVLDSNSPDALENMVRLYRISKDNSKLLSALSRLSQLQFKQKLYQEARYSCRSILELSPDHEISIKMLIEMESQKARKAVRIRRLAMLYVSQNKFAEATNQYKRILDLVPDNLSTLLSITHILEVSKARNTDLVSMYQTLAGIYEKKSRFDQGLEFIDRIIQLNPSDIADHERKLVFLKKYFDVSSPGQYRESLIAELRLLSELQLNSNRLEQAIQLFRELITLIPGDLALQEKLAVVYQDHKNLDEAYQLFKSLSVAYSEAKDAAGVKRVLEKALDIQANDLAALKTLAELEIQSNNYPAAIKHLTTIADISTQSQAFEDVYNAYQRILEIDTANFEISMKYAQILAAHQQNERAVKILGNILEVMETQKDEPRIFKILSKILEFDPDNIVALEKLALIYASHDKTQDALKAYQRLAGIYRQKGEMEHALKIYQMALELSPKDYGIRRDLADIHAELGLREEALIQYMILVQEFFNESHFEEAILELDKILKIDPSHLKAQKLICDAYYSLRQFANAYPYLISLAQYEDKHNNPDTAIGYLKKAIQIKPDDLVPLEMMIEIFHRTTSSSEDIPYYVQLADLYLAKKQFDQSRTLLEEAFGMDPFNKDIYTRLIQEYLRTKNIQQAIKTAFYIAQLHFDKGQFAEAETIARKHLELQPDFLDGHYFLISIYQRLNKARELTNEYLEIAKITASQGAFDQAINAYENAIQLNPNVFSLRDHLIDLLVKIGRKEEAVRELNNLAKTYQDQRKPDMALMVFRKALELDPDNLQLRQSTFNLAKQTLPEESLIDDYMGMAGIYFKLNQIDLGWNLCKDIFRIGPGEEKNYKQLFTFMEKIPNRPETARYLVKMCDYFTKKKVYDFAVQSGEKAMMFEGANPQLVENIAYSYANNGNIPRATDYYQVLINLYKMKGSTNKVLDNYRKILELSPYNIPMHQAYIEYFLEGGLEEELTDEFLALTEAFIHHQEWQNAMSMVDKVMRIDPTNDKAFEKMNLIGEMEAKAAKQMKSASPKAAPAPAAQTKPTAVPVTQFSHPNATSQKTAEPSFNPDDTIGTRIMGYIRTLEINPNHYVARTKLIELYLQKNQKEDAIVQYAILADTYAALEDYSKAVEALQKLLVLKPDHGDARGKLDEYQRKLSDGS